MPSPQFAILKIDLCSYPIAFILVMLAIEWLYSPEFKLCGQATNNYA